MTKITSNTYFKSLLIECGLLLKHDDLFTISIDSLSNLFPNAMIIKIIDPIFDPQGKILSQFHQFLSKSKFYGLEIQRIDLISPSFPTNNGNEIIAKFQSVFFNSGWTIKSPHHNNDNGQEQTPGNDNYTIQILKQLESPRRKHEKSYSQPNTKMIQSIFSSYREFKSISNWYII